MANGCGHRQGGADGDRGAGRVSRLARAGARCAAGVGAGVGWARERGVEAAGWGRGAGAGIARQRGLGGTCKRVAPRQLRHMLDARSQCTFAHAVIE